MEWSEAHVSREMRGLHVIALALRIAGCPPLLVLYAANQGRLPLSALGIMDPATGAALVSIGLPIWRLQERAGAGRGAHAEDGQHAHLPAASDRRHGHAAHLRRRAPAGAAAPQISTSAGGYRKYCPVMP